MAKNIKKDLATSFTSLLFLVIMISGIMLFFHWNSMSVKTLHEILGLVFSLAVIFHVRFNWKQMKQYFSKKIFFFALVVTTLVSTAFVIQANSGGKDEGGDPKRLVVDKMLSTSLKNSSRVLGIDLEVAKSKLKEKGIIVNDENKSLKDLSEEFKKSPFELVFIINSK